MAGENARETLLEQEYHENCPGCKADQQKVVELGLPVMKLFTILIVVLATGIATNPCAFVCLFKNLKSTVNASRLLACCNNNGICYFNQENSCSWILL